MQFATTFLALTAAIATSVNAAPSTSTLTRRSQNPNAFCYTDNPDITCVGRDFARYDGIDWIGNDHPNPFGVPGPTFRDVEDVVACASKCVEWNSQGRPYCAGVSYVPNRGNGWTKECWLKSVMPGCGNRMDFTVHSAILKI